MRRFLESMILDTRRELAHLEAAITGASTDLLIGPSRGPGAHARRLGGRFQAEFETSPRPYLILDPRPGLHIVDINDAYARATMASRDRAAGERIFDVFPDNPSDPSANGVSNLYSSFRIAAETGRAHEMDIQHYDVRDPAGCFVTRHWQPINTPIFDDGGHLMFLLHHVEDITERVVQEEARSKGISSAA